MTAVAPTPAKEPGKTPRPKHPGGRPKGSRNKATIEIQDLARQYTTDALKALVQIAQRGQSEAARVMAANALLDRGYGKPRQALEHSGPEGAALPSLTVIVKHAAQSDARTP